MADSFIKQLLAYSLLVVGYWFVRKYSKFAYDQTSTPPTPQGHRADAIAAAIIELTESMEYHRDHAYHIPEDDLEAREEVVAWMSKASDELQDLVDKYIETSRLDVTGKETLEIQDGRGREVKISLRYKDVEEFPDQIGYRRQKEMLKNLDWGNDPEL